MSELLEAAGVPFERVAAFDVRTDRDRLAEAFDHHDVATDIEMMIGLSHIAAWERFAATGEPAALFMEDDVHFSSNFASVFRGLEIDPDEAAIWRLETYHATVTATRQPVQRFERAAIYEIHSNHAGAAAYVLSRAMALKLLDQKRMLRLVVDQELFDPKRRHIVVDKVYQCIPAPCIQDFILNPTPSKPFLATGIGGDRRDAIAGIGLPDVGLRRLLKDMARPLYRRAYSAILAFKGRWRVKVAYG